MHLIGFSLTEKNSEICCSSMKSYFLVLSCRLDGLRILNSKICVANVNCHMVRIRILYYLNGYIYHPFQIKRNIATFCSAHYPPAESRNIPEYFPIKQSHFSASSSFVLSF